MRHVFMTILFFSSLLVARDNPFEPVSNFKEDTMQPNHIIKRQQEFKQQEFSLPNTARVLKYVKVIYQALDGSLQEEQVNIEKAMDWRDRFIITKKSALMSPPPPISLEKKLRKKPLDEKKESKKPIIIEEPKKEDKKPTVIKEPIKEIVKKPTQKKLQKKVEPKEKTFTVENLLKFTVADKILTIHSNDSLLRDLYVPNPYKLVLDFKKKNSFYTKTIDINFSPFKQVVFGSHNGYYRASFALDGPYKYTIYEKEGTIKIHLR